MHGTSWRMILGVLLALLAAVPQAGGDAAQPVRADLKVPPVVWAAVCDSLGAPGRSIGYSADEMEAYGRGTFLLPTVLRLFADVRRIPRFSGRITDQLLADAGKIAGFGYGWSEGGLGETARRCYGLLGVSTARRVMPDTLHATKPGFPVDERWRALPQPVRTLAGRLYQASEIVKPWLAAAFDQQLLQEAAAGKGLYASAMSHRNDEAFDQLAAADPVALRLLASVDLAYLGYATVLYLRYLEYALEDFRAAGGTQVLAGRSFETLRLSTPLGDLLIGGTQDDVHTTPAFLVIELGGDDRYGPGLGASRSPATPIGLLLDLAGNDHYLDPAAHDTSLAAVTPSFGAGIFGIGVLCDLAGDDEYAAGESGLGRGCFGSGLLVDYSGDDTYYGGGRWTQGAAHAGIGVLLDLGGRDHYSCAQQSQGLGATLGAGLLLDLVGDDTYTARDDGNVSALYLNQSVAMSQGCGYGRRADLGDGHSLAGGFGFLVDGAGDDDYHAQVWAQGCGYWWGVGVLEDRQGNDRYRNGKYSSGAAAHFAIGLHVDLCGDDLYNQGNDTAKNQFQGHARDGSLGIFVDGAGDDRYEFRSHCAGSGDLGSIGFFWDRQGDDRYCNAADSLGQGDWAATPPLGSTTRYAPFHSFRDDLPVYGIFIDTGGEDRYETRGIGGNGRAWTMRRYENARGLGMDRDLD